MSLCINGQCTTRDSRYKKHKSEQLPWKFNSLFSCDLDMWFRMWLDNLCHGEQQNGKCLQICVNHLQCTKILLQVSAYVNTVHRQFYDSISLSQFSIFQWYYKNVASLCLEENVCSKNGQKVLCIMAKEYVLRNHSFGQTSFTCSSY